MRNHLTSVAARFVGVLAAVVCSTCVCAEDYVPLSYIESTGTQCIDTRVSGMAVWGLQFGIQPTTLQGNNQQFVASDYRYSYFATSGSTLSKLVLALRGTTVSTETIDTGACNDIAWTNAAYTVNATNVKHTVTNSFGHVAGNVFIFNNSSYNNSSNKRPAKGRLFYFKATDIYGVPLCDLVPAKRTSDNKVGLLDRVSGDFLTDKNGGNFTAGEELTPGRIQILPIPVQTNRTMTAVTPEVRYLDRTTHTTNVATSADFDIAYANNITNGLATVTLVGKAGGTYAGETDWTYFQVYAPQPIPSEYQRVEYIRGTGTQYVDTQYKPGAQTTLVMDYNVGNYVYNSTVFSTGNGWTLFMNGQYKYSTPEVSTGFGMWGANAVLTIKPGSDNFIIERVVRVRSRPFR